MVRRALCALGSSLSGTVFLDTGVKKYSPENERALVPVELGGKM